MFRGLTKRTGRTFVTKDAFIKAIKLKSIVGTKMPNLIQDWAIDTYDILLI